MFFPIFSILVAMVSIQLGASLAKGLFPLLGIAGTTSLRIGFAAILLALLWRPWRRKFTRQEIRAVLPYGTALGIMNLLFYMSLQRIPLGIAVAVEFTGPLTLAILSSRKKMDWLWAALAICGMVLILPLQEVSAPLDPVGLLLALAAGTCWALYIFFGQKLGQVLHGGFAVSMGMIVAVIVTLPFGIVFSGPEIFNPKLLSMALGVAILSSALPYSLEMVGLRALPSKTFSILMSLEPAFAALSGFLFLHEQLSFTQWLAVASVISASAGSSWSARSDSQ